ncbi:hypothetical protein B0H11DRAFT_2225097 [Mycena galericulata]|nr:hypothetical protein B0H11DRAFT_2225097 [Mycena galericulata]
MDVRRSIELPPELWLKCIDGTPLSDLRSLVSVCRQFQDLCQPLLFQHMRFNIGLGLATTVEAGTEYFRGSTNRFRGLATSSHVLSVGWWSFAGSIKLSGRPESTRRRSIHDGVYEAFYASYLDVVETFRSTLGVYRNVRSLILHQFRIDAPFRDTIASLEKLQELGLTDCLFLARTGSLLPVGHFSLSAPSTGQQHWDKHFTEPVQPLHIISATTLRTVTLDGADDASAFISTIVQHGTLDHLERLAVELSDLIIEPFIKLLGYCPQLTHIDISSFSTLSVALPDRLPLTVIPSLQSFKGPHVVARLFTLERPVSAVDLLGSREMRGVLRQSVEALSHSSVALRRLSVEVALSAASDIAAVVADRFPLLEELSLNLGVRDPDKDVDDPSQDMLVLQSVIFTGDRIESTFVEFIRRVSADTFALPADLVVLRLIAPSHWITTGLKTAQLQVVPEFARRLPRLQELEFCAGSESATWVRSGDLWREKGAGEEMTIGGSL